MTPLIQLLIQESPALIALAQAAFKKTNPDLPPPTSEDVIMAFDRLFSTSQARDQFLEAALKAELGGQ